MGADLITIDEYKASEKIDSLKNDARIESLITSVSQLVKTYCANSFLDFYSTEKTEVITLDYMTSTIQVSESPLVGVTSVEERTTYDSSYTTLTEAAYEFYIDYDTDTLYRTYNGGFYHWSLGPGAVKIVYNAGYADTPEDLKLAVIDLVNYYDKDEHKLRQTLGTASIANEPSSTQWRNVSFPDHIKRVLDLHKNVRM
jgi:hypothetical protein